MTADERAAVLADAFQRWGADGARRVATEIQADAEDIGRAAKLVDDPIALLGAFSSRVRTMPWDWPHRAAFLPAAFG